MIWTGGILGVALIAFGERSYEVIVGGFLLTLAITLELVSEIRKDSRKEPQNDA